MASKVIQPRVIVFVGPNGAGKSTHADAIVAALGIDTFVNADYIARGLSGRNTDAVAMQAGRIMLTRLKELARCARRHGTPQVHTQCEQLFVSLPALSRRLDGSRQLICKAGADDCIICERHS